MNIIRLPKSNQEEAREAIADIATRFTGRVFFSEHAEMRMLERDISPVQVMRVLRSGEQERDAEWDTEKERGWKLRLTRISAGTELTVIAKLVERESEVVIVVTTF